jgi:agmatinase
MKVFDPDAAASKGSGIFGLNTSREDAKIVLVPVPFAATVSYGSGAENGPEAILAASHQVDLYDWHFGRIYEAGIHLLPADPAILAAHGPAREAVVAVSEGGDPAAIEANVRTVDAAGALVNASLRKTIAPLLDEDRIVGVIGGDHSIPFAAIAAAAEQQPLGILHIDAHADLRIAYEGFEWSHASIMHNVLEQCPGVQRLVQVGVRDYSEGELQTIHRHDGRVVTHFDADWHARRFSGVPFDYLVAEVIGVLPDHVWISFDIDGLDPSLCPNTGTPVPGGFSFAEVAHLLARLAASGRRIVGFDLVEVVPGEDEWDANVAGRLLYKLCGAALRSRSSQEFLGTRSP